MSSFLRTHTFAPAIGVLTVVGLAGCFNPSGDSCRTHCWEHRPIVEDANGDSRFDEPCGNGGSTPQVFTPPLPPAGFFIARACTDNQGQHDTIKAAVSAILASDPLNATELSTYQNIVDDIAASGVEQCVAHLIGDDLSTEVTEFTDIDPSIAGIQSCILTDAEDLCDLYVRAAIHDELDEVLAGGNQVPQTSTPGLQILGVGEACYYVPEVGQGDTDSASGGSDGGSDPSTTGADSGSSGFGAVGPWGDLSSLVSCSSNRICAVDRSLINTVTGSFATFYDEGVQMTLVSSPAKGVQLTGVDRGEDSHEFIDAFGLRNNDVITEVAGIKLDSEEGANLALTALSPISGPVEFKVVRREGTKKATLAFEVRFVD